MAVNNFEVTQGSPVAVKGDAMLVTTYVITMLLSASLLFLVQPMFARMALPLLGGTPAVWAIAMCFFQAVLLGGYCYAHLLKKFVPLKIAVPLHVVLMGLAWFALPVSLPMAEVPTGGAGAGLWLIALMAKAIGYPFFFVSATSPLLQSWFARTTHRNAGNPYFLYSASNIGSLGALVAYPFVVEPLLGLHNQALLWSFGYMILAGAIGLCGLMMLRAQAVEHADTPMVALAPVSWKMRGWWIFMAFVPSALLVAWTNHITTDIASAPFLWLPPLMLFLLTFVMVFRDRPMISMKLAKLVQVVSLPIAFVVQFALPLSLAVPVMIIGALSFFSTAIICHRQLYESRPEAGHLTEFYMLMSVGGVLGGLFVSLLAPLIFSSVFEYPLLLVIGIAARLDILQDEKVRKILRKPMMPIAIGVALMGLMAFTAPHAGLQLLLSTHVMEAGVFGAFAYILFRAGQMGLAGLSMLMVVLSSITGQNPERVALRSYFGVLSVTEATMESGTYRLLNHGTTVHGAEKLEELAPGYTGKPHALTYYSPEGGMARALLTTQDRLAATGKNALVRVIGLGTGSLACYAKPGEDWAYYEIDRDVIKVAEDKNQFTFLSSCAPGMKMIEGDARITLNQSKDEKADYLLVDAFSSDSIPVHLITTEAMQLYMSHVKDDGVLVIHVTNRYMDLVPVVAANMQAIDPALQGRVVDYVPVNANFNAAHSIAIVISKSAASLATLDQSSDVKPLVPVAGVDKWTDDFSNLPSAILRRLSVTKY